MGFAGATGRGKAEGVGAALAGAARLRWTVLATEAGFALAFARLGLAAARGLGFAFAIAVRRPGLLATRPFGLRGFFDAIVLCQEV